MGRGEEDPFGSLINLCHITSSQELKLENCPFALESEYFPDAVDSLPSQFSPTPTPSEPPTGIIMVSPPETDSEEDGDADEASLDKSTPHENEEFQTPPEHHNLSSSSQEDPPRLPKPIPVVNVEIEGSDDGETVAIDDGCGENEANFDEGERGENLGFVETEELEGQVEGIEGFECKFKRIRVLEGKMDGPSSKKIRVSQENWYSETQTVCKGETEITEKVSGGDDDEEEEELVYLDVDEIDEGRGKDEDKIIIDVDSGEEESEANDGVGENGKMQKNGEGVSDGDGDSDSEGETEKANCGRNVGIGNPGEEEGDDLNGAENNVLIKGGLAMEEHEEGVKENGNDEVFGCWKTGEIEKFKCKVSGGVDNSGKEKGAGLDGGKRSLLTNGDLVVEESGEEGRNNVNDEVQRNRKEVSGCRGMEEIDKFRYNGSSVGENRKEIVGRRRELPLSMRGKDNNVGGKERIGSVDVKNLSWKELLDVVAVFLGKVNDGSEDVDFLEAAKRKGMTFPNPRWI